MAYLSRTNGTLEWICNFYMQYTAFVIGINLILVPTSALICWLQIGHFDADYTLHVSKIMLVDFSSQSNEFIVHQIKKWEKLFSNFDFSQCALESDDIFWIFWRTNHDTFRWRCIYGRIGRCFVTLCVDLHASSDLLRDF